ncbi:MAG TPA: thioredoxin domain-containing protein [Elusimicrobiota bacterium]|jgi:protein-disulfide isomerase|nr:thioredoxin domain-containing protein [Elusimicrobiota bacterium]
MRTLSLTLAALLAATVASAAAPDKAALLAHVRESYSIPDVVELSLGDFKASEIPGFDVAEMTISHGKMHQTEQVYLSKDGKHYLLGSSSFRDLGTNADQERLAKMDLKAAPVRGNAKASVAVVQYTDFQCPYCQMGFRLMQDKIMKEYPDNVRWVYKAFPLTTIHPWAEPAAIAAECARQQGQDKFWSLHDALFAAQREITVSNFEEKLKGLVGQAGLKEKPFMACYDGKKTMPAVKKDQAEAEALGVNSTPSFFVNGHPISGGADYASIKEVIEEALKGKHGKL